MFSFMSILFMSGRIFFAQPQPAPEAVVYVIDDAYRQKISELVDQLKDSCCSTREKATESLLHEPWEKVSNLLPKQGTPEQMIRLRRVEKNNRPEMQRWYIDYHNDLEYGHRTKKEMESGEFDQFWANKKPKSVFDGQDEKPLN